MLVRREKFQKNLVVWKSDNFWDDWSGSGSVSEELSSMEIEILYSRQKEYNAEFQKNLVVWK